MSDNVFAPKFNKVDTDVPPSPPSNNNINNDSDGLKMIRWVYEQFIEKVYFFNSISKYSDKFGSIDKYNHNGIYKFAATIYRVFLFTPFLLISMVAEFTIKMIASVFIYLILFTIIIAFAKGLGVVNWDADYVGCQLKVYNQC